MTVAEQDLLEAFADVIRRVLREPPAATRHDAVAAGAVLIACGQSPAVVTGLAHAVLAEGIGCECEPCKLGRESVALLAEVVARTSAASADAEGSDAEPMAAPVETAEGTVFSFVPQATLNSPVSAALLQNRVGRA